MDAISWEDFNDICRICLSKSDGKLIPDEQVLNVFYKLTDLRFKQNKFPKHVCRKCIEKINEIHQFTLLCQRSHGIIFKCIRKWELVCKKHCKKVFESKSTKRKHICRKTVKCEECLKEFYGKRELLLHQRQTSHGYIKCEKCSKSFTRLNSHRCKPTKCENLKNTEVLIENVVIPEKKAKIIDRNEEIIDTNADQKPPKTNELIPKLENINYEELLHTELDIKPDENELQLPLISDEELTHTQSIQTIQIIQDKPLIRENGEIPDGPFKCDKCPKTFIQHTYLAVHTRAHRLECFLCKKKFKQPDTLLRHERLHRGECPFKCDLCSQAFVLKDDLIKHLHASHADELIARSLYINEKNKLVSRPFKCGECSFVFSTKIALIKHELTHNGSDGKGPFICGKCPQMFLAKADLIIHKNVHKYK